MTIVIIIIINHDMFRDSKNEYVVSDKEDHLLFYNDGPC